MSGDRSSSPTSALTSVTLTRTLQIVRSHSFSLKSLKKLDSWISMISSRTNILGLFYLFPPPGPWSFCFVLSQGLAVQQYSPAWAQTHDTLASASQMLDYRHGHHTLCDWLPGPCLKISCCLLIQEGNNVFFSGIQVYCTPNTFHSIKNHSLSQIWQYTSMTPVLGKLIQKHLDSETKLNYKARSCLKIINGLGVVAYIFSLSTLEAEVNRSL